MLASIVGVFGLFTILIAPLLSVERKEELKTFHTIIVIGCLLLAVSFLLFCCGSLS